MAGRGKQLVQLSRRSASAAALACVPPRPVLIAHNLFKFDMPILMSECVRNSIYLDTLAEWLYVSVAAELARLGRVVVNGAVHDPAGRVVLRYRQQGVMSPLKR